MVLCKALTFRERFFEELRARSQNCRLIDALKLFHLSAKTWEVLHISFPALDFFVENHPVEPFPALEQLLGEIQMGARNKAKATNVLLHHPLGFFDPFGYFDFLFPGQKRDLAHLLEIHPHRIVQNISLGFCSLFLFFLLVGVFLTVLVAIDLRRFNNVDLQATQPRKDEIQFIGIGDSLGQRLV